MVDAPRRAKVVRIEFACLMAISWVALASIPVVIGGIGLSWDALNHHIYLGWIADQSRFDRDFMAAASQSLQFPYLYWPVYKLAAADVSGVTAGIVLASLHWLAAPPLWWLSRHLIPGDDGYSILMRVMALALAFTSPVVLSMFDSTGNDLLAAIPLIWGLAISLRPLAGLTAQQQNTGAVTAGLLAGMAVAFKLSNGPIAVLLPLVWFCHSTAGRRRWVRTLLGTLALLIGFSLTYGYWAVQLWTHIGNPIYPFCDACFAPLRSWVGWQP